MLTLDHVMHGIASPAGLAERLAPLGLRAVAGGEHPGWGTANALSYFGLTYLEWLWVRDAAEAAGSPIGGPIAGSLARGEGPVTVIFRAARLAEWAARWRALGLAVIGPVDCSRLRPDGSVLRWRLLLPPWPWPFLIEWAESDEERLAGLAARGAQGGHPGGELRLEAVGWAVRDLQAGAAWLERVYGLRVGAPVWDEELGAWVASSEAGIFLAAPHLAGGVAVTRAPYPEVVQAGAPTAEASGLVSDWLIHCGEGPFLYRFSGGTPRLVPPAEGLGAWLQFGARAKEAAR
jgi:hypothetical protein